MSEFPAIYTQPLASTQQAVKDGNLDLVALTAHFLERIASLKHLNAFLEVYEEEALEQAKRVQEKLRNGDAGKLAGLVLGIKDLLVFENHKSSASSKILEGFVSQFTATAVQRALDEDAIIIGRQNCDEFGMGGSNENSAYGPTLNFDDTTKVPGGSSGGSAVAVQAGLCMASLGTDTGGSVRQPAAFCGIYGLKPTYGRVSRYGLIAYASSFDCIGVFSHQAEDVAQILQVIAGKDSHDTTSAEIEKDDYLSLAPKLPKRVAFVEELLTNEIIQEEIREAYSQQLEELTAKGVELVPVSMDFLDYALPTYYILTTAEASSNLARYDGVRYGKRSAKAENLEELYKLSRGEGFGAEVKRRIMLGTFVLSASYYDAYYTRAQKVRRLLSNYAKELFSKADVFLIPTTPTTAFKLGDKTEDVMSMYYADIFTVFASIAGLPALNIPKGKDRSGMAIGLQFVAAPFKEKTLLDCARLIHY